MKKKGILGFIAGAFLYCILTPLISAQWGWGGGFSQVLYQGPRDVINFIQNFFSPFFEVLLGVGQYDQYFFARILLLLLIFVVIFFILGTIDLFKKQGAVKLIVAAVFAILGARYFGDIGLIEAMLLPYGVATIAISVILPFLLFFYFVHKTMESGAARRVAWVFFGVVFLGLWWSRRVDTGYSWIYNVGLLVVVLSVIFDKKVHEYFGVSEMMEAEKSRFDAQIARVEEELNRYGAIANPSPSVRNHIARLEERREELSRKKARL